MSLEGGLDLRALVEGLNSKPIILLACHLVRELLHKYHQESQNQVDSLRNLLDQHLVVLDKVGARDFLLPPRSDWGHEELFRLDAQLVVLPILDHAKWSPELIFYVER